MIFPPQGYKNISYKWLNQGMIFRPHGSYSGSTTTDYHDYHHHDKHNDGDDGKHNERDEYEDNDGIFFFSTFLYILLTAFFTD